MAGIEVLGSTVGAVAENSFTVFRTGSDRAIMIDPGDEPDRLDAASGRARTDP